MRKARTHSAVSSPSGLRASHAAHAVAIEMVSVESYIEFSMAYL